MTETSIDIDIHDTPNHNAKKFVLTHLQHKLDKSHFFTNTTDAKKISTLAATLFKNKNIDAIFLLHNFITITKKAECNWNDLKPFITQIVMKHVKEKGGIIDDNTSNNTVNNIQNTFNKYGSESCDNNQNKVTISKIKTLLKSRIEPVVAKDGGNIQFKKFNNGVLVVDLQGACKGCPSAQITLKNGVENLMKYYVPEVQKVIALTK